MKLIPDNIHAQVRDILHKHPTVHALPYWAAGLTVGFVACVYSEFFSGFIRVAENYARTDPRIFVATAPCFFVLSYLLVQKFAPEAGGTGVPRVHAAIQLGTEFGHPDVDRPMSLRVAGVVMLSSLIALLGGGGLGREGPMVHIAACIFYFIGSATRRWWPFREPRSWLVAGGAAGVAAAFNTPLAGVVFVIEELAAQHFQQFKTVILSSVIMAGMMAQWLTGRYLHFGFPKLNQLPVSGIVWVVVVAIGTGIAAGIFLRAVAALRPFAVHLREKRNIFFPALIGLLVAVLAAYVSSSTIGGGLKLIGTILFEGPEVATWPIFFARFASTVLTYLSGVAGGFLAPSLSLGAVIGSNLAQFVSPENHNLLVLTGMAGFLAAVTSAPFTALVIVMEMTDRHSAIFPLMIGAVLSHAIATLVTGIGRK